MTAESTIGAALGDLAPSGVIVGVAAIDGAHRAMLTPHERTLVRNAVPSRVDEFATGRMLLRRLLGVADDIGVLPTRAPALPHGAVGSLAHDDDFAVAAVSWEPVVRAIGIDVEPVGTLPGDEAAMVIRPDEGSIDPRLAFVLKEATYKAWSSTNPGVLDFHEVRVDLDGDRFEASVLPAGAPAGPVLTGRFVRQHQRWLALVVDRQDG